MNPQSFALSQLTQTTAVPTRSLFVGDLSFFCTEIDLVNTFSKFGEVLNTEVKRSRGGDSLMHGFVDFAREADATRAIQYMNGRKFMGRKLKVNWTNQKCHDTERNSWVQVHVNFLSPNVHSQITEEFLETIFVRFGNFADISVKRHLCSFQPAQVTGYAYVYFLDAHAALRAIYGLRSGPINGVFFECCLSHKSEQMLRDFQGMNAVIKRQQTSNPSAFFKRFESHPQMPQHQQHTMHVVHQQGQQPQLHMQRSQPHVLTARSMSPPLLPSSTSSLSSSSSSTLSSNSQYGNNLPTTVWQQLEHLHINNQATNNSIYTAEYAHMLANNNNIDSPSRSSSVSPKHSSVTSEASSILSMRSSSDDRLFDQQTQQQYYLQQQQGISSQQFANSGMFVSGKHSAVDMSSARFEQQYSLFDSSSVPAFANLF